jgi:hypothetical protein
MKEESYLLTNRVGYSEQAVHAALLAITTNIMLIKIVASMQYTNG